MKRKEETPNFWNAKRPGRYSASSKHIMWLQTESSFSADPVALIWAWNHYSHATALSAVYRCEVADVERNSVHLGIIMHLQTQSSLSSSCMAIFQVLLWKNQHFTIQDFSAPQEAFIMNIPNFSGKKLSFFPQKKIL